MPAHFSHTRVRHLAVLGFAALLGGVGIAQQVQTVSMMAFLEGPTSDKDGNVYFVEMVTPRRISSSPKTKRTSPASHWPTASPSWAGFPRDIARHSANCRHKP